MQVRESIIEELKDGVRHKAQVIDTVMEREQVTIQAVYKELRKLVADEMVLDKQKKLSLTLPFIEGEYKRWKQTKEHYTHQVSFDDFLQLQKGKSLSFTFTSIIDLDLFWTQSFIILERILPEDSITYSIIPHDWFMYARPHTDEVWVSQQSRLQRVVITHPAEVDWQVVRIRRKHGHSFTGGENPLKLTEYQYVTLVGDWVFEVVFDKAITKELNEYIWSLKNLKDIDQMKMEELMKRKGSFRLKLSNNAKKAREMASKAKKFFD